MKRLILFLQLWIIASLLLLSGCATVPTANQAPASNSSKHIALLLPLSGQLSPYATAIRNGFFTAYYEQKNKTPVPPTITVVDTTGKPIQSVYKTAVADGANFIVGPLNKADVTTLVNQRDLPVPVLALNTSDGTATNSAVTEFALSPTDEAQQAASKAWQDRRRNVIILAPNTPWGTRLTKAFSAQWKSLGGNIVATQYYGNISTLSKSITGVLQINQAYQDNHTLERMLHEDIRMIPQRRQDFDSIFLVGTPAMDKQVQLLLRFYFAGNVPVYTTSQVYSPNANHDGLDGILFCDMSWVLTPNQLQPAYLQNIQQHVQAMWPDNYARYAKFYAMGADAFMLTSQLRQLQSDPNTGIPGATGVLYLTPQHRIYRQLLWAQFKNGRPQLQS